MPPKLSVAMTTYNHRGFIAECLTSVLTQTFQDIEIIVADDASTDGTQDILRDFAKNDERIVPIYNSVNLGLSVNANNVLKAARGEYITCFAGDDIMLPELLEKQVAFLDANPDHTICMCDVEVFDSDSGEKMYSVGSKYRFPKSVKEQLFFTNWFFYKKTVKGTPTSTVRRSYYLSTEYDDFDTRFPHWNEVLKGIDNFAAEPNGKIHTLPEVLARYRRHSGNMSADFSYNCFEEALLVYTTALARYPRYTRQIRNKMHFILFQHLFYDWHSQENYSEFEKQFRIEAGWIKYIYLKTCKFLLKTRLYRIVTVPLKNIINR